MLKVEFIELVYGFCCQEIIQFLSLSLAEIMDNMATVFVQICISPPHKIAYHFYQEKHQGSLNYVW